MENMSVKLNYAIFCDQVITEPSGKISIIGAFTRIKSQGVPAVQPKFSVIVNTYGDSGKYKEKVEIVSKKDNKTIVQVSDEIEIKPGGRNNFVGNLVNVVFPDFGEYWLRVTIDQDVLTDPDLHYVKLEKDPE